MGAALSTGSGAVNVGFAGSAEVVAGCASFSGVRTAVNAILTSGCAFTGMAVTDAPNCAIGFCAGSFDLELAEGGVRDKAGTGAGVGATVAGSVGVGILIGSAERFFGAGTSIVVFAPGTGPAGAGDSSSINNCAGVAGACVGAVGAG